MAVIKPNSVEYILNGGINLNGGKRYLLRYYESEQFSTNTLFSRAIGTKDDILVIGAIPYDACLQDLSMYIDISNNNNLHLALFLAGYIEKPYGPRDELDIYPNAETPREEFEKFVLAYISKDLNNRTSKDINDFLIPRISSHLGPHTLGYSKYFGNGYVMLAMRIMEKITDSMIGGTPHIICHYS